MEEILAKPKSGVAQSFRSLCKVLAKAVTHNATGEPNNPLLRLIQLYAHIESVHAKSRFSPAVAENHIETYVDWPCTCRKRERIRLPRFAPVFTACGCT